MVKAVAAQRDAPRRAVRKAVGTGESPRALFQPGGLQRAVVKCSVPAIVPGLRGRVWVRGSSEPQ